MKHVMPIEYRKAMLAVVVVSGAGVGAALLARRIWLRQKNVDRSVDSAAGNSEVSSLVEAVKTASDVDGVTSSNSGATEPVSVDIPNTSNSMSTSGTFEKVPSPDSPTPVSSDQLRTAAVSSPPKIVNTKTSSTNQNDVTVVMKDKIDIVGFETEPSKETGPSPAADVSVSLEASKVVQQPLERPTIVPTPSLPGIQPQQPVVADTKPPTPTNRIL